MCTCSDQGGYLRSDKGLRKNPEILKMVVNGEARRAKQVVKIIKCDGKFVYAKPHYLMLKGCDTFTTNFGSEAEDLKTSPKSSRNHAHLRLTPIRKDYFPKSFCTKSYRPSSCTARRAPLVYIYIYI